MSLRFTDCDGVEWRVEWKPGNASIRGARGLDWHRIPRPPGGMHFNSEGLAFVTRISKIDPSDLTELELQRMIGAHTVH